MNQANIIELLIDFNKTSNFGVILTALNNSKLSVRFALACAEGLEQFYDVAKYPKVCETRKVCLELVANWLLDSSKVTKKDLTDAAEATATTETTAAYAAAFAAANAAADAAAYAAAYAAFAAANAAAYAAFAAANAAAYAAADATAYAAFAAANAAAYAAADATAYAAYTKELRHKLINMILIEYNIKNTSFNLLYLEGH